tara:strand:+ start:9575 stop:10891 length:1317 start_codon:yes stop_codon:yes gene_type:complete
MARPDARIPLGVQQRDFSSPLTRLNDQAREDQMFERVQSRSDRVADSQIGANTARANASNAQAANSTAELTQAATQRIAMDTLASVELLEKNQVREAGQLIINTIDTMESLGLDTSEAVRFANLASQDPAGAAEYARKEIVPVIETMQPQLFPEPESLKNSDIVEVNGVKGRVGADNVFTPLSGVEQTPSGDSAKRSIVQILRENGDIDQGFSDGSGNFFNNQNEPIKLAEGDRAVTASLTGSASDLGITNPEKIKLDDAEIAAKTFIATAGDALKLLEETPDANTFIAGAANIVNSLEQEAEAIGRALGADSSLFDPSTYEDVFESPGIGIQSSRMKSLITSLAFQAAAASGQTGRGVSDRDVKRFIEEIGAGAADPETFSSTIRDVADRVDRGFRINYSTRARKEFEGDLGLEALGITAKEDEFNVQSLSDDELFN